MNVDAAKQSLAQALAAEEIASSASKRADHEIMVEAETALSLGAGDNAVEDYARWLPTGRERARLARITLENASQEVALARSALILAKNDEKAVRLMLETVALETGLKVNRQAQDELDEAGFRCRRA